MTRFSQQRLISVETLPLDKGFAVPRLTSWPWCQIRAMMPKSIIHILVPILFSIESSLYFSLRLIGGLKVLLALYCYCSRMNIREASLL